MVAQWAHGRGDLTGVGAKEEKQCEEGECYEKDTADLRVLAWERVCRSMMERLSELRCKISTAQ